MKHIKEILEKSPLIAAIRDIKNIDAAIESSVLVIFMLCGDVLNIENIIQRIRAKGKIVFIHMDFIEGLGKDSAGVKFIKRAGAHGIITARPSLVRDAKNCGIYAIQRLFMLDSRSLETGIKNILDDKPDAVEIMPGIAAKVIKNIHKRAEIPVIAGGLILEKEDIINALSNGAIAVSTSNISLWEE